MKNKKGFTLVELVIVIAVIAVLAAVLIPTFAGIIEKAKENARFLRAVSARDEYIAGNDNVFVGDLNGYVIKVDDHYYQIGENGQISPFAYDDSTMTLTPVENANEDTVYFYTVEIDEPTPPEPPEPTPVVIGKFRIGDGEYVNITDQNVATFLTIDENNVLTGITSELTGVTELDLPHYLTGIGNNAFASNSTINYIIMYDGITCLAENAFLGCSNLEKLIVPDSVISIGHLAFNTYHALEVYYTGTETQWNAITKDEELRFHFMYYPFTVYSGYDYNENWFVYTRIY